MLKFVLNAVAFVVVPGIFVSILIYAVALCFYFDYGRSHAGPWQAISGGLAGLILFAVYVISSAPGHASTVDLSIKHPLSVNVAGIVLGLIAGFVASLITADQLDFTHISFRFDFTNLCYMAHFFLRSAG